MDNEQLTDERIDAIWKETRGCASVTDKLRQFARAIASELRTLPTALPVAEKYVEGFLCRAWGETDLPEVALARTREEIIAFIIRAQYGDTPLAELYEENRQIIEEQIATMDLDVASCAARWEIEFEIGGISVERVTFLYAAPQTAQEGVAGEMDTLHAANQCVDAAVLFLLGEREWPEGVMPLRDQFASIFRAAVASPPPSPKEGSAIEGGDSTHGGEQ